MKNCTHCNKEISSSVTFCPYCGAKQEVPQEPKQEPQNASPYKKFCPACGHQLDKPMKFCPACGNSLENAGETAAPEKKIFTAKATKSKSATAPKRAVKETAAAASYESGEMNSSQSGLLSVVSGNVFLIFVILFTVNLFYQLFSGFTLFKVLSSILTILVCIGLWMIFVDAKNGTLSKGGFSIIKIIALLNFLFYFLIDAAIFFFFLKMDLGATADVIVYLLLFIHLLYWICLLGITSNSSKIAHGSSKPVTGSFYITFVLCLNVFIKICSFIWLGMVQHTTNEVANSVLSYGNTASSQIAALLNGEGLNYALGYNVSSSLMNSVLQPASDWIRSTFGIGLDIPGRLLAIAVPIFEIIILSKLSACKNKKS